MLSYVYKSLAFTAEEMGVALKRAAFSPNIRDRMDHSCVIADGDGRIVAQAEHIPVHLGSFHVGLREFLSWIDKHGFGLSSGDVIATNDPFITGTHVNDVILVAPVYYGGRLVGLLSNKAHHVSIGGAVPGGLNPDARSIYDEGFVFEPVLIAEGWRLSEDRINQLAENVELRRVFRGDLAAQFASLYVGYQKVVDAISRFGLENYERGLEGTIDYSRRLALSHLSEYMKDESHSASDILEVPGKDIEIRASLRFEGDRVRVELSSAPQLGSPFNAVLGVSFSAVSTAIMFLLRGAVPANHGFYSVIDLRVEEGSLLNPYRPSPVGFGNLETSMRIFDVVSLALAHAAPNVMPAAGSGTMMNVVLYGDNWVYYETIAGGSGGRPDGPGVSGVHSSMTNTLNTPVEVIEKEYPILIEAYKLRRGSGGRGLHRGGDGVVRIYKSLGKTCYVVVGNRFRRGPWGLWGGGDGLPAKVIVKRKDNESLNINVVGKGVLESNDRLVIMTPGGGGWGNDEATY
ncbi:MAG: 5-oxoprolinase [Desulfurococcales archaeon]|jgi:N-methylhydantoinase B|nr:5-oxoprolinase [Desulfurococcales archaeon]